MKMAAPYPYASQDVRRAMLPVLPPTEEFPYTMLLQSEVLESNGSTAYGSAVSTQRYVSY